MFRIFLVSLSLFFGSSLQASVVNYEISSGPVGPLQFLVDISIDQSLLPASLAGSRLRFQVGGGMSIGAVEFRSGGMTYEFGEFDSANDPDYVPNFDQAAIFNNASSFHPLFVDYCEVYCDFLFLFNRQGDVYRFLIQTLGDPASVQLGVYPYASGTSFYDNSGNFYRTSRRPVVTRTGEVVGALPVPLPASGVLLLSVLFALGLGAGWKRSLARS